jgi:hypothetical protein
LTLVFAGGAAGKLVCGYLGGAVAVCVGICLARSPVG